MRKEIFIGSSTEALDQAKQVRDLLSEIDGVRPILWSEEFRAGDITILRIGELASQVAGAVFLATPDDDSIIKEEQVKVPRANVLFEFGYFTARLERAKVALCRYDPAELPTDFAGLTYISMGEFRPKAELTDDARKKLLSWARRLAEHDVTDTLTQRLVYLLRHLEKYPYGPRNKYWKVLYAYRSKKFVIPRKISARLGPGWKTAIHEAFRVLEVLGLAGRRGKHVWITKDGIEYVSMLSQKQEYSHAFRSRLLNLGLPQKKPPEE